MFLPITPEEVKNLGWSSIDIIFITGDAYIDSSYIGVAVLGKYLLHKGFKVAIIPQPSLDSDEIKKFGQPNLFWGVTAGSVDSMVANYTSLLKKRKTDDYTPGGLNNKRPDRAVIKYVNLIRQHFKNTKPIVIGGIEASLRRIAHYDYWSDSIKRSILFDSKADYLVYGMAELTTLQIAQSLKNNLPINDINGLCYISKEPADNYIRLADYDELLKDKFKLADCYMQLYANNDPLNAVGLMQKYDNRYLIHNPPMRHLTESEIDEIYNLDYENKPHPIYKEKIKAIETISDSITTHRGCYGECNFCAIAVHQGTTIVSRSEDSILNEVKKLSLNTNFKGYIKDLGGPTANMYKVECAKKLKFGKCKDKRCIADGICSSLKISHRSQINLLEKVSKIPSVKKAFIASGIRPDLIYNDSSYGKHYLKRLIGEHVSGQLKIAPEHVDEKVLKLMGKPSQKELLKKFVKDFYEISKQYGKKQFLTYYMIAAHPGCDINQMKDAKDFMEKELHCNPEQVQIFTPLPLTISSLMYFLEYDPFEKKKIFVEKGLKGKRLQKELFSAKFKPRSKNPGKNKQNTRNMK
ncbi:YgiQ family radical SAM protein [Deferribacteraceae bacterium V6Fe1]|nr:YgiQ family radical SAM protein [Deferribacteraceae bacterium V6Fe1]